MEKSSTPGNASTKPYLLRAIYQWAIDNQLTPQVMVDAETEDVLVPLDCIQDGRIVLNIHPRSVQDLEMDNHHLQFSARFSGKPFNVCIPIGAVVALYCRENGQGIVFQAESFVQGQSQNEDPNEANSDADTTAPEKITANYPV